MALAPYCVPLSFGYEWGLNPIFCFHGATAGRKLDIISRNSKGCASFVSRCDFSLSKTLFPCDAQMKYASVIAEGDIELIRGDIEQKKALTAIIEHYKQPKGTFDPEVMKRVRVFRLIATQLSGKANH
jgi:nitroimidazol reductase NimA-like FMN-containing flavoprotein (pyridoxamine 5'-phosphate oxidase superfamily)